MISATYGRMIRRYEGASPVPLDAQFRAGKVEAMSLLSDNSKRLKTAAKGGSLAPVVGPVPDQGGSSDGSLARKLPPAKRRKVAD